MVTGSGARRRAFTSGEPVHERDVAAYFSDLFRFLAAARRLCEYDSQDVERALAEGVTAARAAGVPAERLLAELKQLLRAAPLVDVGEAYRRVLIDRLVLHAIEVYYGLAEEKPGGGPPAPNDSEC